jgi:hypothetical protein
MEKRSSSPRLSFETSNANAPTPALTTTLLAATFWGFACCAGQSHTFSHTHHLTLGDIPLLHARCDPRVCPPQSRFSVALFWALFIERVPRWLLEESERGQSALRAPTTTAGRHLTVRRISALRTRSSRTAMPAVAGEVVGTQDEEVDRALPTAPASHSPQPQLCHRQRPFIHRIERRRLLFHRHQQPPRINHYQNLN